MSRRGLSALLCTLPLAATGCGGGGERRSAETGPASARLAIEGTWRGRLSQEGLAPFVVTATIRAPGGSRPSRVHYTGIDCSGTWTLTGRAGRAYRFREVIDSGAGGSCKGVGVVSLVPVGADRLRYEFRGGGITSRGLLARVS